MLVITRQEKESVTVGLPDGREMRVIVSRIKNNQVRIGFNAPSDITIQRFDEEQILENRLIQFRKNNSVRCTDSEFVKTWMDMKITTLDATPREVVRREPKRVDEVWSLLKKELE